MRCENRSQIQLWYKTEDSDTWVNHPSIFVTSSADDPTIQYLDWDSSYLPEGWNLAQIFVRVPNCEGIQLDSPVAVIRRSPQIFRRSSMAPIVLG